MYVRSSDIFVLAIKKGNRSCGSQLLCKKANISRHSLRFVKDSDL